MRGKGMLHAGKVVGAPWSKGKTQMVKMGFPVVRAA